MQGDLRARLRFRLSILSSFWCIGNTGHSLAAWERVNRPEWGSGTVAPPDPMFIANLSAWRRDSGTPSPFVVKLTVTESSACICKKSLTESISDSNL